MKHMRESDWKLLSQLKPHALERLCERILKEVTRAATDNSMTQHERYGTVYGIIEEQDKTIARIFNDLRRSNGYSRLEQMREAGLVTVEEFGRFSEEARQ